MDKPMDGGNDKLNILQVIQSMTGANETNNNTQQNALLLQQLQSKIG